MELTITIFRKKYEITFKHSCVMYPILVEVSDFIAFDRWTGAVSYHLSTTSSRLRVWPEWQRRLTVSYHLSSLKVALTNVAVCRGRECLLDAYYWRADSWSEDVSRCGCRNLKLLLHGPSSRFCAQESPPWQTKVLSFSILVSSERRANGTGPASRYRPKPMVSIAAARIFERSMEAIDVDHVAGRNSCDMHKF